MTRLLSALALLPIVIGTVWWLPPVATLALAMLFAVLAFVEYRRIAGALGAQVDAGIGGAAVILACTMMSGILDPDVYLNAVPLGLPSMLGVLLLGSLIAAGAIAVGQGQPGPGVLANTAATLFAPIYIGLPLGALAAVRQVGGREAVGQLARGTAGRDVDRQPFSDGGGDRHAPPFSRRFPPGSGLARLG